MGAKKAKKRWVDIAGPEEFSSVDLGSSYCFDPEDLIGRKMKVNLMHLTKDMKKQNTRVTFELVEVKNGKVQTKVSGFEIIPAHIKRVTKRNKSKIDDSFECFTKDNVKLKVKPLIVTKNLESKTKLSLLRKKIREFVCDFISKKTYSAAVKSVLSFEIQKKLSSYLKKTTPINISLIRKFDVLKQ